MLQFMKGRGRGRGTGHRADHTGVITVVLVAIPVAVALYLSLLYRLGVPATVVTTLLSGGAPAGVYLGWASYRNSRPDPAGKNLAAVVDDLADAIRRQWDEEARVRRLYDPYALPVSWAPADGSLVDPWDVLVKQAANAGPGRAAAGAGTWAAGPDELEGTDSELSDVLLRVPTGRLVVLGAPGTGKTVLMVRLVRDLLERRVGGAPVPVLVPLASWDPAKQELREWLTAQLTIDYPALEPSHCRPRFSTRACCCPCSTAWTRYRIGREGRPSRRSTPPCCRAAR